MMAAGSTDMATHNAIGKIYVILKKDPEAFLTNNRFYDPEVRGKRKTSKLLFTCVALRGAFDDT